MTHPKLTKLFAAKLREMRDAKGLTQRELAERAGLHTLTVSHFERGRRSPSLYNLRAVVSALECDANELLCLGRAERVDRIRIRERRGLEVERNQGGGSV